MNNLKDLKKSNRKLNKKRCGVHQFVSGFTTGDAISNYALELQQILKSLGYESDIFSVSQHTSIDGRVHCKDYKTYRVRDPRDIIIFHFSIGTELTEYFKNLSQKKILVYHNITPPDYFKGINREKYEVLNRGREELKTLSGIVDLALGVSEYNRQELSEMTFKNTGVLRLILNEEILKGKYNKNLLKRYDDNYINFLAVGRLTPNKKLEDVIKVFYYYKKCINSNARLFLVGGVVGDHIYVECLRGLAAMLDLTDVIFTLHVNNVDLRTYYNLADVFITMSDHEGFCIPLLEGMYFNIPVVAYNSSAIPEILGGSGVLIREKNYKETAELVNLILSNANLKNSIIKNQNSRLEYFSREKTKEDLKKYMKQLGV